MSGSPEREQPAETDQSDPASERHQESGDSFEQAYKSFVIGELTRVNEDGSETVVRAYELILEAADQEDRRGLLVRFGMHAAATGHSQAIGPVTLPEIGYADTRGERPLTAIYFFLESPSTPQSPDPTS